MEQTSEVWAKFLKAKKAKENNNFISELEEAYKFCCPRRYNKDEKISKDVYDSTAIHAVQSRAASNHDALFPAFREWIGEEVVTANNGNKVEIEKQLKARKDAAHKAIELSNFHVEIEDVLTDALFSDGALLVFSGTPENPLRFKAVDWCSFYSLNDLDGEPTNNFMMRKLTLKAIKFYWPKADMSLVKAKDDEEIDVMDCYTYDEISKEYTYSVFVDKDKIYSEPQKSSPWVVFNQRRRINSKNGWGQVLDTMPNIRTTNKVVEDLLKHAAINLAGIWQADDDGVLNTDNLVLTPGAIIPKAVGSNGLTPLHSKLDMNLTQFVLQEEKDNIKKNVQGSALPDFNSGIRTASEYQMRDAEMKKVEIPSMLQLAQGSKRLIRRIFDILESDKMKSSEMFCQKVTVKGTVVQTACTSPLIRAKSQLEMKTNLQLLATAAQIFGQAAYEVIDVDGFLRDFYLQNNFSPDKIKKEEYVEKDRERNRQNDIEMAQAGVKRTQPNPGNVSL